MRIGLFRRRGEPAGEELPEGPLSLKVLRSGNTLRLVGADLDIFVTVEGIDLPEDLDCSFAAWFALPIAMRRGCDLHIDTPLDPAVIANAQKLSAIWQMWVPDRFSAVKVTGGAWCPRERPRRETLMLFSGGVDSTYALLKGAGGGRRHVLTIQGNDYPVENQAGFDRLLARTAPLLDRLQCDRIVLRTNVRRYLQSTEYTHGFILAGSLFVFRDLFAKGCFAADYTPEMDMLVFPWGTNHVTNPYFAGTGFSIETVASDVTRTGKIGLIAEDALACSTLAFCRQQKVKPDNCGRCRKCLLSKIRFQAVTGRIPPIFLDTGLTAEDVASVDLSEPAAYAAFTEIRSEAGPLGLLDRVPSFEAHFSAFRRGRPQRRKKRLFGLFSRRRKKLGAFERNGSA